MIGIRVVGQSLFGGESFVVRCYHKKVVRFMVEICGVVVL